MNPTVVKAILFVRKLNAPNNPVVISLIDKLTIRALSLGITIIETMDEAAFPTETLIISVGGDGTMLHAMRLSAMYHATCTGFHAGRLGFLNDFSAIEDVDESINVLLTLIHSPELFETHTEKRIPLQVHSLNGSTPTVNIPISFNEVAISRLYSDQIVEYNLIINGESVGTHRSNSILLSTPTGSTAYSLSAGGSIILPCAEVLQVVPVAPNTLGSRPLIIPMFSSVGPTQVTIEPLNQDAALRIDGMKTELDEILTGITVQAGTPAKVLHNPSWSFFTTLSTKLGWFKESVE